MQKVYDFGQKLFCLIFTCYIRKLDAGGGFDINLGVALAERHRADGTSGHAVGHLFKEQLA